MVYRKKLGEKNEKVSEEGELLLISFLSRDVEWVSKNC